MKSIASITLLSGALMALAPSARATFLVDPTGGTSLVSSLSDVDDGSALRSLGGSFSLYGTSYTSLYVQANGFLSTLNGSGFFTDRSVTTLASAVGGPVISPFYDDLYLDTSLGDTLTEKSTASYYAVTYAISGINDFTAGHESNFQAALIKTATVLQNNVLLPGDIVLSYGALGSTVDGNDFTVGVGASSTNGTGAFGVTTGQFATATSFLGNFNPSTQALLYRFNPTTGVYTQSLISYIGTPTPEPGALAALGLGAVALVRRRRR